MEELLIQIAALIVGCGVGWLFRPHNGRSR